MRKLAWVIVGMIMLGNANAEEGRWYLVNREDGCEPLTSLYDTFPTLKGKPSPASILASLKETYPDAKMEPFLDVIAEEHRMEGSPPTADERAAYKPVTRDNALVISFQNGNWQLVFFTEKLCKVFYRASQSGKAVP